MIMPQAPKKSRQEGKDALRLQEKQNKREKGAMSCAECRRLKLKCDKTVPCGSCKRRGCSQICPNGSLVTGQGTRFVLADTEKLHDKINVMSDRIRQLEEALTLLQSTLTREPHPLMHKSLLQIKSIIELHGAFEGPGDGTKVEKQEDDVDAESQYIDAFGTLAIRDDGAATFYGRSAGSESLLIGEASNPNQIQTLPTNVQSTWHPKLPVSVTGLSDSFPFSSSEPSGLDLEYLVRTFLPPWSVAWHLVELYLELSPWFYGAVTKTQLMEELLPMWYSEAENIMPRGSSSVKSSQLDSEGSPTPGNSRGAHELALLFVIFCFGALADISLPPAPENHDADKYYNLARAALSLEPVLDRPPSVSTVQALSIMAIYRGLVGGENSIESTWALYGLSTKLAQSIGLHRDCARWKLPPAEVQKRRELFWELFITDCWQSLATGRLATFSLPYIDCELASDPDQTIADDGSTVPGFLSWKARFGAECVSAVVLGLQTARAPKYSVILDLDRKIRDMALPKYSEGSPPNGVGLVQTMSHFTPINYRHTTLVYVHRCFFAQAVTDCPHDPLKSQYAPSFLAGYRSACELLNSLTAQFKLFPAQIARFWVLWTHAFSSAVMIASIVTRATGIGLKSKVTSAALIQLRSACELFENASAYGGRAMKFLPILTRLLQKAHQVVSASSPIRHDIFTSSRDDKKDELSIFGGKTHSVATKVTSSSSQPRVPRPSAIHSPSSSASPEQQHAEYLNAYPNMHPMLVDQINGFEGHLTAQIHTAYDSDSNPYLPIASSNYQTHTQSYSNPEPQYHQLQPQTQPPPHFSPQVATVPRYHQPAYVAADSHAHPGAYQQPYQYANPGISQNHQWTAEQQYPSPEPISSERVHDPQHYDYQRPPTQVAHQSLQETWTSFMYTPGSPSPFMR